MQFARTFEIITLNYFSDIKKMKEDRVHFEKTSSDLDDALQRNSQVLKSKMQECAEANNFLLHARMSYRHSAIDYVKSVSMLQASKRHEILSSVSNTTTTTLSFTQNI